jgi:hypothetical protein
MPSEIYIGATQGGMVRIDTLFETPTDRQPRVMPINHSEHFDLGDRKRLATGWKTQVWHWGFLSSAMWEALRAYANTTVYVKTIGNAGTAEYYTATLIWPDEEPEHWANRVLEADITLRDLVTFTP